jgi:hypothetical protein
MIIKAIKTKAVLFIRNVKILQIGKVNLHFHKFFVNIPPSKSKKSFKNQSKKEYQPPKMRLIFFIYPKSIKRTKNAPKTTAATNATTAIRRTKRRAN